MLASIFLCFQCYHNRSLSLRQSTCGPQILPSTLKAKATSFRFKFVNCLPSSRYFYPPSFFNLNNDEALPVMFILFQYSIILYFNIVGGESLFFFVWASWMQAANDCRFASVHYVMSVNMCRYIIFYMLCESIFIFINIYKHIMAFTWNGHTLEINSLLRGNMISDCDVLLRVSYVFQVWTNTMNPEL